MTEENRSQSVSLGCGTLILIAAIVYFFSNHRIGHDEMKSEIGKLRVEITDLRKAVEAQSELIKILQPKVK